MTLMESVIKEFPNRNVLSFFLNFSSNVLVLRLRGKLFQFFCAATLKDPSPNLFVLSYLGLKGLDFGSLT